jgi:hypothetical protein
MNGFREDWVPPVSHGAVDNGTTWFDNDNTSSTIPCEKYQSHNNGRTGGRKPHASVVPGTSMDHDDGVFAEFC